MVKRGVLMKTKWRILVAMVLVFATLLTVSCLSTIAYADDGEGTVVNEPAEIADEAEDSSTENVRVVFSCSPEDAVIAVFEGESLIEAQQDGSYLLLPGDYQYSATAEGFQSIENATLTVTDDESEKLIELTLVPVELPAEEPAEEPSEEPAEEPSEEPAEEPAEEPSEEPAEEPSEEPAEEPAEEPIEEPSKEPADGTSSVVIGSVSDDLNDVTTGWVQDGGYWYYYYSDGSRAESTVVQIGSAYFGFDYDGRMYDDTDFDLYDYELGRWVYYRAKAGGRLYVNAWVEINGSYYYYGEGGKAPSGLATANGSKQYYFYYDGRMAADTAITADGKVYIIDSNGSLTVAKEGWNQVGDYYYYVKDGNLISDQILQIGSAYFGFDYDGRMYDDTDFDLYDYELGRWVYYRAKAGGRLYVNAWVEINGSYYYYGEGGKAPSGLATANGSKQYYFYYDGRMATDTIINADGKVYIVDSNGSLTVAKEGWNEYNDDWYYVKDGVMIQGQVILIGSSYFGFDYDGRMYDNTSFSFYDNESGRRVYYRAKEGGKLYVNEWVEQYETWYYYGEGGKTPSGITTVGSKQYYFYSDGSMAASCVVSEDGKAYTVSAAGALSAAKEGWNKVENNWYYVQNGELIKDKVMKIGSDYYAFYSDGEMLDDSSTDFYDSESGRWVYYRAREGGKLYVNEWVKQGETWYYYGEGGKAPSGITTVGSKQYYFYYDGRMAANCIVSENGKPYTVSAAGALSAAKEGWNKAGNNWYYVQNGELIKDKIVMIGSDYYAFYSDGKMLDDSSTDFYDSESGRWVYYRAREGGKLYVNEWVKLGEYWYYYGAGGKAPSGLYTVDGKQYYFYSEGRMAANCVVSENGKAYTVSAAGTLSAAKEGWNKAGNNWYYVQNGQLIRDKVIMIGSDYYAFYSDGRMLDNSYYDFYDSESGRWAYYRAREGGKLYVNEWVKLDEDWYYYGEGGKAPRGITTVGSKQYYFYYDGRMAVSCVISEGGKAYTANSSGVLSAAKDGWNEVSGHWYYVTNGTVITNKVTKIGSYYYGFDYNGRMYDDTIFDIYDNESDDWVYYCAKEGGKLYVEEWLQRGSYWYYYGAGGKAPRGLTTVGSKQYLFSYDGHMLVNAYYPSGEYLYYANGSGSVTKVTEEGLYSSGSSDIFYVSNGKLVKNTWKTVNGNSYYFGEDYYAYINRVSQVKGSDKTYYFNQNGQLSPGGWIYLYSSKYYARTDGSLVTGEQKIDGKWYYFDEYGLLQTGLVAYKGHLYLCGSDGAYIGEASGNGWNQIKGSWYYIENNNPVTGIKLIKNVRYYFNENGLMMTNTITDGYVFDGDGKQVTSGWYKIGADYLYVDSSTGKYVTGEKTINNKTYFFGGNGIMVTGEIFRDGKKYVYDTNGVLKSTSAVKSGWYLINGIYYYYENDKPYNGWKGSYYISDGRMLTNTIIDGYWVGKDGKYVNSNWVKCDTNAYDASGNYYGDYMYAKSGGKLARNEWQTIGGKSYYFGSDYRMITGIYVISGKVYSFDSSGRMTATLASTVKDGWLKISGSDYAYIASGQALRSDSLAVGSDTYAFDADGYMVRDNFYYTNGYRFFGSDGRMAKYTGWKKIDGEWYYFNSAYRLVSDMVNDNGKTYLCGYNMRTGWVSYNRKLLQFNSNGILVGEETTQNGWVQKDGIKYYIKNGSLIYSGIYTIDGKTYGFKSNGSLAINMVVYSRGAYYFCGSDGTVSATEGWKKDQSGYQYYTDANGCCLTGIRQIGSKTYYFSEDGQLLF